jgi:transcriptional regulator with PAS, ATPase and Fis domain
LYDRARERLVKAAKERQIPLRQNYNRLSKQTLLKQSRYAHTKQMICEALKKSFGNAAKAAQILGISSSHCIISLKASGLFTGLLYLINK